MKRILPIALVFAALSILSDCYNQNRQIYSFKQANARVLAAFAVKSGECGYTRNVQGLVAGGANKSKIKACVLAIMEVPCSTWGDKNVQDPTPYECLFIEVY